MVKALKQFFTVVWRIWFYFLTALLIFLLLPILIVLTSRTKWYPVFFWVARNLWAKSILIAMGFFPKIEEDQRQTLGKSYMLVANHTSIIDIMLMLRVSKNPFVFVGKKELVKIPVFGYFYKRICIMVDRESVKSRSEVFYRAKTRLNQGLSLCIFPEGGVPEENVLLADFKSGAFRLAVQHQIPIVPMVFFDCKKRFPFSMVRGKPGPLRVRVLPFIKTKDVQIADFQGIKHKVFGLMETTLKSKHLS